MKNHSFAIKIFFLLCLVTSFQGICSDLADENKFFEVQKKFWTKIYTKLDSDNYVFHDKNDMKIIYKIIKVEQDKNQFIENILVRETLSKELESLRLKIKNIKKTGDSNNEVKQALNALSIKPESMTKKSIDLLVNESRYQRGQKNFIETGFINLAKDQPFIKEIFAHYNVPEENMVISILESSYNDKAVSKVEAIGVWQMMANPAKTIFGKFDGYEPRLNRYLSSLGAAIILSENYLLLKRWDLAISAYNSGISHYLKFLKQHKKDKKVSLPQFINDYSHSSIGFAARNFYAEFLALKDIYTDKRPTFPKGAQPFTIFILGCATSKKSMETFYKGKSFEFAALNPQFKKELKKLSPGMMFFAPKDIPYKNSVDILKNKKNYRPLKIQKNVKC